MAKNLAAPLIYKKNARTSSDPWVFLFYLDIDDDYLAITDDNAKVTFSGVDYYPYPAKLGDVQETSDGSLPEADLTVSNVTLDVNNLLEENKLIGNTVTVRMVNLAFLHEPSCCDAMVFFIKSAIETNEAVTFKLSLGDWFNKTFPGQNWSRNMCRRIFGTSSNPTLGCSWDGVKGNVSNCDHTLNGANGCRAHGNVLNFGAEPGIPRRFA